MRQATPQSKARALVDSFLAIEEPVGPRCSTCQHEELAAICAEFFRRKKAGETGRSWASFWKTTLVPNGYRLKYCTLMNHVRGCLEGGAT